MQQALAFMTNIYADLLAPTSADTAQTASGRASGRPRPAKPAKAPHRPLKPAPQVRKSEAAKPKPGTNRRQAVREILAAAGRATTNEEILKKLVMLGLAGSSAKPLAAIGVLLATYPEFKRVGRGLWTLADDAPADPGPLNVPKDKRDPTCGNARKCGFDNCLGRVQCMHWKPKP